MITWSDLLEEWDKPLSGEVFSYRKQGVGMPISVVLQGERRDAMDADQLEIFQEILAEPSVEAYEQVLEILLEEFFAERGCMWLERENRFVYRGDEELRRSFPFSRQAVDEVLEQGVSFLSLDATKDERFRPSGSVMMHNVRSCLCAASRNEKGDVLVLAYFDNGMTSGPFAEKDLEMLKEVLSLVPGAVSLVA